MSAGPEPLDRSPGEVRKAMVRFGPSGGYAEEAGTIQRFDVRLAAGTVVELENGRPATEEELDGVLWVAGPSDRIVDPAPLLGVVRRVGSRAIQPFPLGGG